MSLKFQLNTISNPFLDVYVPALILTNMTIPSIRLNDKGEFTGSYDTPGVNMSNMESIIKQHKDKIENDLKGTNVKVTDDDATNSFVNSGKENKIFVYDIFRSTGKIIKHLTIETDSLKLAEISEYTTDGLGNKTKTTSEVGSKVSSGNINRTVKLLDIDSVFVTKCTPTWSKHRTESGIPLYCDIDLEIESLYAANDSMIIMNKSETNQFKSKMNQNFMNRNASRVFR
jgi:hypothetical protein